MARLTLMRLIRASTEQLESELWTKPSKRVKDICRSPRVPSEFHLAKTLRERVTVRVRDRQAREKRTNKNHLERKEEGLRLQSKRRTQRRTLHVQKVPPKDQEVAVKEKIPKAKNKERLLF